VDNYCTHRSKATRAALEALGGRIKLPFLPRYCPWESKMELEWLHLHRNVTCNHQCRELEELMERAQNYLRVRAEGSPAALRAAA
jgi:transposase